MSIKDLQRRGRQIGEIRLGEVIRPASGKPYPSKLSSFRLTTKSPQTAQAVAQLLGGQARHIELLNGNKTWEVLTDATELPVMVPPGDNVISQFYEMWTAAGCARRCDGEIEQLSQEPCKCPSDSAMRSNLAKSGGACKPITRVNVMLPDLPDLGVWLLSSTGWNAANELGGAAEVLAAARNQGVIIPATLRLEQRTTRKVGQKPNHFVVPVLEIRASLRQMTELQAGDIAGALPEARPQVAAIGAGPQLPVQPVDDDEPIDAEIVDDDIQEAIGRLGEPARRELVARMHKANFPEVTKLSAAAEKQVRVWIDEIGFAK